MKQRNIKNIGIFLLLMLVITACTTDETCRKSRKVEAGMTFYLDTINAQTGRWVEVKITFDSLWVNGVGNSKFLYEKKPLGSIQVPLNQFAEESKFNLRMSNIYDTITVVYKNQLEFLSLECGSIRTHVIDTAYTTGHFIDSITIINRNVNTQHVENIKLHHIE